MSIINPEVGAIDNYLWVKAQEGIKLSLEAVRDAQNAINTDYDFDIETNLYRPTIEKIEDRAFVNILIGRVTSDDSETNFNKTHIVTYNIDCYVRGRNEDNPDDPGSLVPADEVAVERLQYLCAMVEFALTKLANFYQSLNSGDIIPDKIDLNFNPVEDASESVTPYAPARFEFICKFPYNPQDLENLPELNESFVSFSDWASEFLYT